MMRRYPHYRAATDRWFPAPPSHWNEVPLWTMFTRVSRRGFENETLLSVYRDHGVVPKASRDDNFNRASEDLSAYQLVEPGDLVINKMKAWQGSLSISRHRGIVSPAYFVYRPHHHADDRFLHHLLRSQPMIGAYIGVSKGVRIGQWDLEPQQFSRLKVSLPPVPEQRGIADYLESETQKVDALIAEQEGLVRVLRERRAAVIERTLESASVTTSGQRLKHVVQRTTQGWSPQCYPWPADGVDTWGVLKAGAANGGLFRPTENKELPPSESPRPDLVVRRGHLVISRANTRELVGSAAVVDADYPRLMLCDKLYAFDLNPASALPHYVALTLGTRRLRDLIELEASGSSPSMQNISQADIVNLPMDLPTVDEQQRLLDLLDEQTRRIDSLIAEAEGAVAVAKERRSALIAAAVTGEIDVRGEVA